MNATKRTIQLILLISFACNFCFADDEDRVTVSFTGTLTPKVLAISAAIDDSVCDGDDYATCKTKEASASFSGHQSGTITASNVNLTNSEADLKQYFWFEMKSSFLSLKNDYVQLLSTMTSNNNDLHVTVKNIIFKSVGGGLSGLGQTTLGGITVPTSLAANEVMIGDTGTEITNSTNVIWDTVIDLGAANNKVIIATPGNELIIRGIIEVTFSEDATSAAFQTNINFGIGLIDG